MAFTLGPVGGLRALPSPSLSGAPDATAARIGAVHRSLTGRVTVDRVAVKRVWVLSWPYLDPGTAAFLDAIHLGMVAGPLWLLDGERPNRLTPHVAATGSAERTTTGFTASAGALTWTTGVPASTLPLAGGLSWAATAAGGQVYLDPIPVVPGEPLTMSAWAASAAVALRWTAALYDKTDTYLSFTESIPTTPGAAGQRLTHTFTPTGNAALVRVALTASPTPSGGTATTTAWQLEPGPAATAWAPGGGAAVVAVDALTTAYAVPGSRAMALMLLEV
ncbi:hypothetical protein [Alloactinosynnema sp. L-07]|uniref:hypothetical protein n=1 Tax=Alloactinosynnema sp. L-07 TaxID=1653480 RepID=UPI00065EF856|nr:hypothetical protein [Alloactinosynnema sp. L-07]CRK55422.1 hypothetical protein [Alloactinosynnema sp. L-07]